MLDRDGHMEVTERENNRTAIALSREDDAVVTLGLHLGYHIGAGSDVFTFNDRTELPTVFVAIINFSTCYDDAIALVVER